MNDGTWAGLCILGTATLGIVLGLADGPVQRVPYRICETEIRDGREIQACHEEIRKIRGHWIWEKPR